MKLCRCSAPLRRHTHVFIDVIPVCSPSKCLFFALLDVCVCVCVKITAGCNSCVAVVSGQVRVFTFSVGQHNYDVTPLQWIACSNKGKLAPTHGENLPKPVFFFFFTPNFYLGTSANFDLILDRRGQRLRGARLAGRDAEINIFATVLKITQLDGQQ